MIRSVLLLLATALATVLVTPAAQARWQPAPTTESWQWQLQGKIDTTVPVGVYEVDGFDVDKQTVAELQSKGIKVICYLSVGSWENYRSDADAFPETVLGKIYDGFPDERWLDIRKISQLKPIMDKRFEMCARKGFDAVEPDNVNGFENDTGLPLTRKHQLRFNRFVARRVHAYGMSVALKNDGSQAAQLVDDFDFAVVEECFRYNECDDYSAFVEAGKAVFATEYELAPSEYCAEAAELRFSVIRKSFALRARPWRPCPSR